MKKIWLVSSMALLLISCQSGVISPDIEVVRIRPLGYYITSGSRTVSVDTAVVIPRNSVDCHIIGFIWEYYDANDNMFFRAKEPFPLFIKIAGLVEPAEIETTEIYNLTMPIDSVTTYLQNNDFLSAKAKIKFIATDDYTEEQTDTAEAWIGLYLLKIYYIIEPTASAESTYVGDTVQVSARLVDGTNSPIAGETLFFSTTLGTMFPPSAVTDGSGLASSNITSSSAGSATITITNSYAAPNQVLVKFY